MPTVYAFVARLHKLDLKKDVFRIKLIREGQKFFRISSFYDETLGEAISHPQLVPYRYDLIRCSYLRRLTDFFTVKNPKKLIFILYFQYHISSNISRRWGEAFHAVFAVIYGFKSWKIACDSSASVIPYAPFISKSKSEAFDRVCDISGT